MFKIPEKLKNIFDKLSSKPVVGGLYITDSSVQYFLINNDYPQPIKASVSLPAGVIEEGKVKNHKKFVQHLSALRNTLTKDGSKQPLKVITCLPSAIIYAQHISIPNVGPDQLEGTANLNLKMNSPVDINDVYTSWELIRETPDVYDIMGVFSDKKEVDKYRSALMDSGFYPVVFEFPSLATSWTVNKVLGTKDKISLVTNVSPDGIDIFLLKKGFLYFNYFISWRSIKGKEKNISKEVFEKNLIEELKRVISFSDNQFNEHPHDLVLISPGMEDSISKIINDNFDIKIINLKESLSKMGSDIPKDISNWYTVMGSAIRGNWERGLDKFISIGTENLDKVFYRERILSFIRLWRNIFAGALTILLILIAGAGVIIAMQPQASVDSDTLINIRQQQQAFEEIDGIAQTFNSLVSEVRRVSEGSEALSFFLNDLYQISNDRNIRISQLTFSSFDEAIEVSAVALSPGSAVSFRDMLNDEERFRGVTLPFSDMSEEDDGTHFNISFMYQP